MFQCPTCHQLRAQTEGRECSPCHNARLGDERTADDGPDIMDTIIATEIAADILDTLSDPSPSFDTPASDPTPDFGGGGGFSGGGADGSW